MAERRMFAKTIIDSDSFLDMPLSTQALYFHLSMRADDEGFINNPKKIGRMIGASDDDLKVLIAKKFIIPFESGIVVIKHWRIHNYIQKDRFKGTVYKEERQLIESKENGSYTLVSSLDTDCIQDGYNLETQVSIGKVSKGKDSKGKDSVERHKYGANNNVLLSDDEYEKLKQGFPYNYNTLIDNLSYYIASTGKSYKSHYMTILNWARKDHQKNESEKKGRLDWIDGICEVLDIG